MTRKLIQTLSIYRDLFKNWYGILFFRYLRRNVIKVIPRNIEGKVSLMICLSSGAEPDGMLVQNFSKDYYSFVAGKCDLMVDIGSSIGDSSIFLLLNGAHRVLALESNYDSYSLAKENIEINHFQDKIILLNAAYCYDGKIKIKNKRGNPNNVIEVDENGYEIPSFTLKTLLSDYSIQEKTAIPQTINLKMSCAGCEKFLVNEDDSTLKLFSKVQVKFDNGYKEIYDKFKNLGFYIDVSFLDYPLRGWLYMNSLSGSKQKLTDEPKNLLLTLDEFISRYSQKLSEVNIPLTQTPEFNFSFNEDVDVKPVVSVHHINDVDMIFSVITFSKIRIKGGVMVRQANIRGGPVDVNDTINFPLSNSMKAELNKHFSFTIEELKKFKAKVDVLYLEPLQVWKDKLNDVFSSNFKYVYEHCDLFFTLPASSEELVASFNRLARRKINMAIKSGITIEEISKSEIESHVKNFGKIWVEMWKRAGKDLDSTSVEKQILKLYYSGIAKIFAAKLENKYIAYRVNLIDNVFRIIIDFTAPSSSLAYEKGANYLLVYNSMMFAINNNYQKWAFWGIDCDPNPGSKGAGIYAFKSSFVKDIDNARIAANIYSTPITLIGRVYQYLLGRSNNYQRT